MHQRPRAVDAARNADYAIVASASTAMSDASNELIALSVARGSVFAQGRTVAIENVRTVVALSALVEVNVPHAGIHHAACTNLVRSIHLRPRAATRAVHILGT